MHERALWHYAVSERLVRADVKDEEVRAITRKLDPSLPSYAVAIGIGLLWPKVAVGIYLAIALWILVPFRAIGRWIRRKRERGE